MKQHFSMAQVLTIGAAELPFGRDIAKGVL